MAFEGDLSNLALGDVLQTLAMSRQTGTFVIRGPREERRLLFGPRGCGLLTVRQAVRERVVEYVVGRGLVSEESGEQVRKLARRRKDAAVDELLRESGAVSDPDLLDARRYVAAEEIYDLFLWPQGSFQFDASDTADQSPYGNVWFDVSSISMEAARRMDEVGRLHSTCPLPEVLRRTEGTAGADPSRLGRDAALALDLVDGLRTVEGLLTASRLGRFDTWKALDALLENGFLRFASPQEVAAAADELRGSGQHDLAVPMLRRVLAERPEDEHARQGLVASLVASGEKRAAAAEWNEIGRLRSAAGDVQGAAEAHRAAVKLDKMCADAHAGLARALFAAGEGEPAAEAARTACGLLVDAGEVAAAVDVADLAVRERPEDASLRIALANAYLAAGDAGNGVALLGDAASLLDGVAGEERRVLDVYRRIVQLDPERRDCAARIDEIETTARSRRRRLLQRAAIGVGVLLTGLLAIPLFAGPSVESRLESADAAARSGKIEDARAILASIPAPAEESPWLDSYRRVERTIAKHGSKAVVEATRGRLQAAVDAVSTDADRLLTMSWADCLDRYAAGVAVLDGPDAVALGAADEAGLAAIRRGYIEDVRGTVQAMYSETSGHAARVTTTRERLVPDLFRKEDPEILADVVHRVEELARIRTSQDWGRAARSLEALRRTMPSLRDGTDQKILEAIQTMVDGIPPIERDGARALAALRKRQLLDRHREAHTRSLELMGAGKLDEAASECRQFLESCDAIRRSEPRELYAPIVRDWLEGANLEAPQRERLAQIESILAAETEADAALERDDTANAFRIRANLVRKHRTVDFRPRFRMPLRIESRPAGAAIVLVDDTGVERPIGTTPLRRFEYGIDENLRIAIRLDGFEERAFERRGAVDDGDGVVSVDLPKRAEFTTSGLGTVQSPATAADGRIVVAGRDGRVRLLSDADGSEVAPPFATGSLAGVSGAPAVVGSRIVVATLDGTGFVLDTATLRKVADVSFDGPVRGSLISVPGGVAAATESGTVAVIDPDGRPVWSHRAGRVSTDPALAGSRVVVVTADGELLAWDAATGANEVRIVLPEDPRWGAPLGAGDRVFVAGDAGRIVCADLVARKVVWSHDLAAAVRARPAMSGGRVLVATAAGSLHALDAGSGEESWRHALGSPVRHPPVTVGDGFVAATERGTVVRFDETGAPVWRFDAKDDVSSPPALVDGRLLFATRRGVLIALRP